MTRLTMLVVLLLSMLCISNNKLNAQASQTLNNKQKGIVAIAALTAKGNLDGLKVAFNEGLDAGLTINDLKEMLVHLYAYCGFPRSLNGITTLMAVLEERKARGIEAPTGTSPVGVTNTTGKYEAGKKNLERLTGKPETGPKRGYAAFLPAIDTLLKEHLFADVFGRGVLTDQDRELTTVSALVSMGGVESQLRGHLTIAMHIGLSEAQLRELLVIEETRIGKREADAGRNVLSGITSAGASASTTPD